MAALFQPYITAAQEAQIPLWALIEHAAATASTGLGDGLQQFCAAANAGNRERHCGPSPQEPKPCSSRQARQSHCSRQQQHGQTGEVVNFQDLLQNAATIASNFFGGAAHSNSESNTGNRNTEVLSVTLSPETGFEVNLDVSQYSSEDLNVKAVENSIVIEAKHSEKQDGHGFVARSFTRRYVLPETINAQEITCKLASNGVLTLTAPPVRKTTNERSIPINFSRIPTHVAPPTSATSQEPTSVATATAETHTEPSQTEGVPVQSMEEEVKLD